MTDEQFLLANAYFDGELDADERSRAEADPSVMAEVTRLTQLAAALGDVEAPSSDARERAIAAALGEFDRQLTPASAASHAGVTQLEHRRRRPAASTWLAVAAGALGVGLFGAVIAQNGMGGDDDDSGGIAAEATAEVAADARLTDAEALELAPATMPTAAQAGAFAESAEQSAPAEEGSAAASASADVANDQAAAPAATEAPAAAESVSAESSRTAVTFDPVTPITDPLALADVGADLLQREQAGTLGITPETQCGTDPDQPLSVLALGQYQLPDGSAAPALIAVDRSTGATYAIDPDTCETIAVAP